jgi:hypothetical protein
MAGAVHRVAEPDAAVIALFLLYILIFILEVLGGRSSNNSIGNNNHHSRVRSGVVRFRQK